MSIFWLSIVILYALGCVIVTVYLLRVTLRIHGWLSIADVVTDSLVSLFHPFWLIGQACVWGEGYFQRFLTMLSALWHKQIYRSRTKT